MGDAPISVVETGAYSPWESVEEMKEAYDGMNYNIFENVIPKQREPAPVLAEPVLPEHVQQKISDRYALDEAGRLHKRDPY
jgi:hypothetical protein